MESDRAGTGFSCGSGGDIEAETKEPAKEGARERVFLMGETACCML